MEFGQKKFFPWNWFIWLHPLWIFQNKIWILVIQVWNSKIDFNMEALSISCRNKHWSKYFYRILNSLTGFAWPLWCSLLWTLEQPAPQRLGIMWDNQLMKTTFNFILWSVFISVAYAECLHIKINFWISDLDN